MFEFGGVAPLRVRTPVRHVLDEEATVGGDGVAAVLVEAFDHRFGIGVLVEGDRLAYVVALPLVQSMINAALPALRGVVLDVTPHSGVVTAIQLSPERAGGELPPLERRDSPVGVHPINPGVIANVFVPHNPPVHTGQHGSRLGADQHPRIRFVSVQDGVDGVLHRLVAGRVRECDRLGEQGGRCDSANVRGDRNMQSFRGAGGGSGASPESVDGTTHTLADTRRAGTGSVAAGIERDELVRVAFPPHLPFLAGGHNLIVRGGRPGCVVDGKSGHAATPSSCSSGCLRTSRRSM